MILSKKYFQGSKFVVIFILICFIDFFHTIFSFQLLFLFPKFSILINVKNSVVSSHNLIRKAHEFRVVSMFLHQYPIFLYSKFNILNICSIKCKNTKWKT